MSIEALWTVVFGSNTGGTGGGVVIFETGRIFGGDPDYIYLGKYDVSPDGKRLAADVEVTNYSNRRSSIFGPMSQFQLRIEADVPKNDGSGTLMQAKGYIVSNPDLQIGLLLTRRAPLP
jgi:hypothetical protein